MSEAARDPLAELARLLPTVLDESALTGEAMPSEKSALPPNGEIADPFDLPNLCFMGAAVVSDFPHDD